MYDIVANLYLAYEIYYQLLLKLPNFWLGYNIVRACLDNSK